MLRMLKRENQTEQNIISKENRKYIITALKDEFKLDRTKEKKIKDEREEKQKEQAKYYKENIEKLEGYGYKSKPSTVSKSNFKYNILKHLKEAHKNER